ncbi:MAG: aminotransferase class V-fold PLP-dependent enzyme [Desulfosarcinaceae bacterium]
MPEAVATPPTDQQAPIFAAAVCRLCSTGIISNEVGTLQPIEEISAIAREHGIVMHTDAAKSAAKTTTDVRALNVDLLSLAGHKLYAPKGVGVLFIRRGVRLEPFCHGAGQEGGRRAGTENVLEIVGLSDTIELSHVLKAMAVPMQWARGTVRFSVARAAADLRA